MFIARSDYGYLELQDLDGDALFSFDPVHGVRYDPICTPRLGFVFLEAIDEEPASLAKLLEDWHEAAERDEFRFELLSLGQLPFAPASCPRLPKVCCVDAEGNPVTPEWTRAKDLFDDEF